MSNPERTELLQTVIKACCRFSEEISSLYPAGDRIILPNQVKVEIGKRNQLFLFKDGTWCVFNAASQLLPKDMYFPSIYDYCFLLENKLIIQKKFEELEEKLISSMKCALYHSQTQ